MELKYSITEEDYIRFNLFHIKNSTTSMRTLKIQQILIPILYIAVAFVLAGLTEGSLVVWLSIFLVMGILWFIFYPKYFYSHILRQVRKMLKEGKSEGLLGEHLLVLSDEGILETTSKGEMKANWVSLEKFTEDEHSFYLYNTALSACIIPKRELEDVKVLRTYIQSRVTES